VDTVEKPVRALIFLHFACGVFVDKQGGLSTPSVDNSMHKDRNPSFRHPRQDPDGRSVAVFRKKPENPEGKTGGSGKVIHRIHEFYPHVDKVPVESVAAYFVANTERLRTK